MFREIQGLRGIAVVAVILFHLDLIDNGYLGVDVFFVISGFVVTLSILKKMDSGEFRLVSFFWSRFRRLAPALFFTIGITIWLGGVFQNVFGQKIALDMALFTMFGLGNVQAQLSQDNYFADDSSANSLLHTWSLSVEAQFYLLLPLLLLTLWSFWRSSNVRVIVLSILAFISLVLFLAGPMFQQVPVLGAALGYYSPVPRLWQFLIGVMLAASLTAGVSMRVSKRARQILASLLPLCLVLLLGLDFDLSREFLTAWTIAVVGALIAFTSLSANDGKIQTENLLQKGLIFLGNRSYSIYLSHWPIIVYLTNISLPTYVFVTLSISLTLLVSEIMFRLLEEPYLSRKARKDTGLNYLALIGLNSVPIALILGFSNFAETLNEPRLSAKDTPVTYSIGCHDGNNICKNDDSSFSITEISNIEFPESSVVLIGDSNAAMYFAGLFEATQRSNQVLFTMTSSGCPSFVVSSSLKPRCELYQKNVQLLLSRLQSSKVVVGFSDGYYNRNGDEPGINGQAYPAQKAAGKELASHKNAILSLGHVPLIVEPIPRLDGLSLETLPRGDGAVYKNASKSFAGHEAFLTEFSNSQNSLDKYELLGTPRDEACKGEVCTVRDSDGYVYRDGGHLTVDFSRDLADFWLKALSEPTRMAR